MAEATSRQLIQTCKVMELTIKGKSGVVYDLLENESFLNIDIYENLFTYFLTARVVIKDHRDIIKNLPVIGGEEVRFSFQDETVKKIYQLKFTLYKHSTGDKTEGETGQNVKIIILDLVSQEGFKAINTRISTGYNKPLVDIIEIDILTNTLNSLRPFDADWNVPGIITSSISLVTNYWTPSEIINFAVNLTTPPDVLFYETVATGFKLFSLNSLISATYTPEDFFFRKNENVKNKIDMIDKLEPGTRADQFKNAAKGVFGNTQIKWNETSNVITKQVVEYADIYNKVTALGKSVNINQDLVSGVANVSQAFFNQETKAYRQMIMNSLNNNSCKLTIPGKMRSVGTLINLIYDTGEGKPGPHDFYSGKWLIAEIKYSITVKEGFEQSIKLVKNAFFGSEVLGKTITSVNR